MSLAVNLRKGWCPGALRPMASGDGLLLRVKPQSGTLSVASLGVIADVAARFGSGEIDLTNRANLQLRGLSDASYPDALLQLDETGLIDQDARVEAVRNIVVDPLSGLDPDRLDIRALAAKLARAIGDTNIFRELPPKFTCSFSGVAEPNVGGRAADIMIGKGDPLAIWLDGESAISAAVSFDEFCPSVERLVGAFLRLRAGAANVNRMRDAVARVGSAAIFADAGLAASRSTIGDRNEPPPVGMLAHRGEVFAIGIGLPFGRICAAELSALCHDASMVDVKSVHVGPQRVLVFAGGRVDALLRKAEDLGLIVRAGDPRLVIDVCAGKPACKNATTDTRRDAQHLVDGVTNLAALRSLHISGCEKGCARQIAAALTIVAQNGRYNIIRNGNPADRPSALAVEPQNLAAAVAKIVGGQ